MRAAASTEKERLRAEFAQQIEQQRIAAAEHQARLLNECAEAAEERLRVTLRQERQEANRSLGLVYAQVRDLRYERARAVDEKRAAEGKNVEFLKGEIESIPLPDDSIDVLISNCVINLSGDKPKVLREAARVLRPGGRFAVSDVIADPDMTEETREDMKQWTGCIAGALTRDEFEAGLLAAGFEDIQIEETHRVHDQASSAIVRATMPS